ncbi:hypothetical protein Moror_10565, partial [Moniliophthora roreri MCA 2997]
RVASRWRAPVQLHRNLTLVQIPDYGHGQGRAGASNQGRGCWDSQSRGHLGG